MALRAVRRRRRPARREHALRSDRRRVSVHSADASGAGARRRARGHDRGPRRDPLDADRRGGVRDRDRRERPLTGEECGMTVEGGRCYYERLTLH